MGIDTVAIGGVAAAPLFPISSMIRKGDSWGRRVTRSGLTLYVRFGRGGCAFRVEGSLSRLLLGNNFTPYPLPMVGEGAAEFGVRVASTFPELGHLTIDELPLCRVDVATDLPVPATRCLIQALKHCYLAGRPPTGWVFSGTESDTFYSKDSRGKGPPSYRSLIVYGKRLLQCGQRGARIEARFHRGYIRRNWPNATLRTIEGHIGPLVAAAVKYSDELFGLLLPHTEQTLDAALARVPRPTRDLLADVGFLAREVPLYDLAALFRERPGKLAIALRKYGVGFGDASVEELRQFANVRAEIVRWG